MCSRVQQQALQPTSISLRVFVQLLKVKDNNVQGCWKCCCVLLIDFWNILYGKCGFILYSGELNGHLGTRFERTPASAPKPPWQLFALALASHMCGVGCPENCSMCMIYKSVAASTLCYLKLTVCYLRD